jgi:hypothetical protein
MFVRSATPESGPANLTREYTAEQQRPCPRADLGGVAEKSRFSGFQRSTVFHVGGQKFRIV